MDWNKVADVLEKRAKINVDKAEQIAINDPTTSLSCLVVADVLGSLCLALRIGDLPPNEAQKLIDAMEG